MGFEEIKAAEIRKGDIIDLVHEVVSVRRNNNFGYLIVKTHVIDGRAQRVASGKRVLYPDETVMRATTDE
ncbi:hypothetical protein SEA_BOMBITAS_224 [Mycobacterium phage Bombitas]|nr:hypothetical protein SEA_BOMBITAS_224 [Mycobacterium phage Bombitas]